MSTKSVRSVVSVRNIVVVVAIVVVIATVAFANSSRSADKAAPMNNINNKEIIGEMINKEMINKEMISEMINKEIMISDAIIAPEHMIYSAINIG